MTVKIYFEKDGNLDILKSYNIGIIGYGNVAKAYALNFRDSGIEVKIATHHEEYKKRAERDEFTPLSIPELIIESDIIFFLVADDDIAGIYEEFIQPNLKKSMIFVFSSGYPVIYEEIHLPSDCTAILITTRIPGAAIREKYLNYDSFFSLVGIHQDPTRVAEDLMLALTLAIGGLKLPAVKISFAQQITMQLFAEQTFSYVMAQILIRSVENLVENGYPAESIMVEQVLSGEGGFTMDKAIEVGMMKQMNFHSHTSQYGQMSRGIKFRSLSKDVEKIQRRILQEIVDGEFIAEWKEEKSKVLLQTMKFYFEHSKFAEIEQKVRQNLGFRKLQTFTPATLPEESIKDLYLEDEVVKIKEFYGGI
ncbi:MAG: NAD(P)-binding domain-containing protein [Candidatus Lokiarchaeota archaeon]|nr:NAD(P)-binding domain-containing protein [Candidatus Lokiarchaeota archaeon]